MKQLAGIIVLVWFFGINNLYAQEPIISDFNNEDNREMGFEILGKLNDQYVIYKNIRWKHVLAFYDQEMRITNSTRLSFIPDKTLNIDFITYSNYFFMIYQYEKNNILYCKAVKMDALGNKTSEPVLLDTTRISSFAENKIYNCTYSQDKQKILIYKLHRKNQELSLVSKIFDTKLNMLDSTRSTSAHDERQDSYSELVIANNGTILVAKGRKRSYRENVEELTLMYKLLNSASPELLKLDLENNTLHEIKLKVDNLNNRFIINSLYSQKRESSITGLYSAIVDPINQSANKQAFNLFPDTWREQVNSSGQLKFSFDNLFLQETLVKKDGGFFISAEDQFMQNRTGPNTGNWNRYNYLYNSPYSSYNDYYLTNPSYDGYYRPLQNNNTVQNVRYYYDNILILSVDANLKIVWNNVITKSQSDNDSDNFLSYFALNTGSEVRFIYIEEEKSKQVISNMGVLPTGEMKRYPTIRNRRIGYEFMPQYAKQVGIRQIIVPCVYRTNIAFARIDFAE